YRVTSARSSVRLSSARCLSSSRCIFHLTIFLFSSHVPFFFSTPATTDIYTLSLHDALPISEGVYCSRCVYYGKHQSFQATAGFRDYAPNAYSSSNGWSVFYQIGRASCRERV